MTTAPQPPVRRTRAEARRDTRERLLAAASEVFVDRGFGAASVEEIAATAGFTRGAFYSNFPDKDGIFLALMDERMARDVEAVTAIMIGTSPATLFDELRAWKGEKEEEAAWLALEVEFRAHAVRNEAARAQLIERDHALRAAYARAIAAYFDAVRLPPPAPVEDLALILHIVDTGIATERTIDPAGVRQAFHVDALVLLTRAATALAATRTPDADDSAP